MRTSNTTDQPPSWDSRMQPGLDPQHLTTSDQGRIASVRHFGSASSEDNARQSGLQIGAGGVFYQKPGLSGYGHERVIQGLVPGASFHGEATSGDIHPCAPSGRFFSLGWPDMAEEDVQNGRNQSHENPSTGGSKQCLQNPEPDGQHTAQLPSSHKRQRISSNWLWSRDPLNYEIQQIGDPGTPSSSTPYQTSNTNGDTTSYEDASSESFASDPQVWHESRNSELDFLFNQNLDDFDSAWQKYPFRPDTASENQLHHLYYSEPAGFELSNLDNKQSDDSHEVSKHNVTGKLSNTSQVPTERLQSEYSGEQMPFPLDEKNAQHPSSLTESFVQTTDGLQQDLQYEGFEKDVTEFSLDVDRAADDSSESQSAETIHVDTLLRPSNDLGSSTNTDNYKGTFMGPQTQPWYASGSEFPTDDQAVEIGCGIRGSVENPSPSDMDKVAVGRASSQEPQGHPFDENDPPSQPTNDPLLPVSGMECEICGKPFAKGSAKTQRNSLSRHKRESHGPRKDERYQCMLPTELGELCLRRCTIRNRRKHVETKLLQQARALPMVDSEKRSVNVEVHEKLNEWFQKIQVND
ncbi:hypothetical protein ACLMJK_004311 [Lecanora helva]